jgi:Tol biopolymer transport system component
MRSRALASGVVCTLALLALVFSDAWAKKGGGKGDKGTPVIACVKEKHANFGKIQGTSYVVVIDADGSNESVVVQRRVDNADPVQFLSPSWSPSGEHLAYQTTSGGIFTVDLDGSNEVRVTTGEHPAWSPDGERIAYTSGADIWTVGIDGTDAANLTATPNDSEVLPTWAGDGRLAYVLWRGSETFGDADVVVHDGGTTTNVTADGPLSGTKIWGISWAKTQDLIAVSAAQSTGSQPAYGPPDIWVIDLSDPANPTMITNTSGVSEVFPSWSSDDEKIVYKSSAALSNHLYSQGDIYTMKPDGTGVTLIAARDPGGKHSIWYTAPDWRR